MLSKNIYAVGAVGLFSAVTLGIGLLIGLDFSSVYEAYISGTSEHLDLIDLEVKNLETVPQFVDKEVSTHAVSNYVSQEVQTETETETETESEATIVPFELPNVSDYFVNQGVQTDQSETIYPEFDGIFEGSISTESDPFIDDMMNWATQVPSFVEQGVQTDQIIQTGQNVKTTGETPFNHVIPSLLSEDTFPISDTESSTVIGFDTASTSELYETCDSTLQSDTTDEALPIPQPIMDRGPVSLPQIKPLEFSDDKFGIFW